VSAVTTRPLRAGVWPRGRAGQAGASGRPQPVAAARSRAAGPCCCGGGCLGHPRREPSLLLRCPPLVVVLGDVCHLGQRTSRPCRPLRRFYPVGGPSCTPRSPRSAAHVWTVPPLVSRGGDLGADPLLPVPLAVGPALQKSAWRRHLGQIHRARCFAGLCLSRSSLPRSISSAAEPEFLIVLSTVPLRLEPPLLVQLLA
jgi:hypothetical protein